MRYFALACAFEGTLTKDGHVTEAVLDALARFRASGRRLLLVTSSTVDDLMTVFPQVELFDRVVAENGAVLYRPATAQTTLLARPLSEVLRHALYERHVVPLEHGQVILKTRQPHEVAALEVIRDLGLDKQIVFNDEQILILPTGVNKATGLFAALSELDLSFHNVVAIGNAANDHSFLRMCECAVAVDNATPAVQTAADFVVPAEYGDGVVQLIDEVLENDLSERDATLDRHHVLLGHQSNGGEVRIRPYGRNLLIAGPSASGKSTATTAFLEQLVGHKYQFCVLDPEGDYGAFEQAFIVGTGNTAPGVDDVIRILEDPRDNAIVNLLNVPLADRPAYFLSLLPRLQELRATTGRPHWLVVDEAHHLLPWHWRNTELVMSQALEGLLLITVHPEHVAPAFLSLIHGVIAVGEHPDATIRQFCEATQQEAPSLGSQQPSSEDAIYWSVAERQKPISMRVLPSRLERRRHSRKYATGELDNSFYFRGSDQRLNLRAQNLIVFVQIGQGVDDDTWLYHLHRGDFTRWFRDVIKDETLAHIAAELAGISRIGAAESRQQITQAIEEHYTLPA